MTRRIEEAKMRRRKRSSVAIRSGGSEDNLGRLPQNVLGPSIGE
jgi:hypothetical protein